MEKHITSSRESFWGDPEVYCDFCKEHAGLPSEFSRRYPTFDKGSRITPVKQHFFLIPSLGQMIKNHVLIVSNAHITSTAQLCDEARAELSNILSMLQAESEREKKQQLVFEHGVPFEGTVHGGCGICHCHTHSVPLETGEKNPVEDIDEFLKEKNCKFERHNLSSWNEIHKWAKHAYLCVQFAKEQPVAFVFNVGQHVESQLMRQFLAEKYSYANREWDWRSKIDGPGELQTTSEQLRRLFNEATLRSS